MSQSAPLFYKAGSESETLHRRITPTADQYVEQKNRWNDLAEFLKERLSAATGLSLRTWLQGSYKFRTQVRPCALGVEFDIDLGVYYEWAGAPGDGVHEPHELKALVQVALEEYLADDENDAIEVVHPKERCCRIRFEGDFHIDVPCYHLDSDADARALATETKGWEESDPKAIYEWFKKCQDDVPRKRLRRVVRYLKTWAGLQIKDEKERPSSILWTVLAADAFDELEENVTDDDDTLEQVSTLIADRLDGEAVVENPANTVEDLNRLDAKATIALIAKLRSLADIGKRARQVGDIAAAAEIWSEAFDHFFPMPEDTEEGTQALAESALQKSASALAVFSFVPDVAVTAVSKTNKHVAPIVGFNSIQAIPKECDITFTVVNPHSLPAGATLKWTVRNHGPEAAAENDLGHVAGHGLEVTRGSKYNGDHSMDLSVFVGGKPIGRRRIFVKIRGQAIAPRRKKSGRQFIR